MGLFREIESNSKEMWRTVFVVHIKLLVMQRDLRHACRDLRSLICDFLFPDLTNELRFSFNGPS